MVKVIKRNAASPPCTERSIVFVRWRQFASQSNALFLGIECLPPSGISILSVRFCRVRGSLWAPDTQTAKYIETLTLTLRAAMRADNNLHSSLSTLRRLEVFVARLQLADSLSCGFTSQSTQNRSFRRRFPKPISWKKTKPNTTKAHIGQSK